MANAIAAILPCLGEASRMRPLSIGIPKVFLPFCGRPLIEYTLEQVSRQGIRTVVLITGLSDELAEGYVPWGRERGLRVIIAKRGLEFGSGGVVRQVVASVSELDRFNDFLVVYPDSVLSINFSRMAKIHTARKDVGCLVTVCYHKPEDLISTEQKKSSYGVLLSNGEGRIVNFAEKPLVTEVTEHHFANTGALILDRGAFRLFPKRRSLDFSRDVLQFLAFGARSPVFGFDIGSGFRYDVGTMTDYVSKQFEVLSGNLKVSGVPVRLIHGQGALRCGGTVVGKVLVGRGSSFASGVRFDGLNIVGRNVRVGVRSTIRDSVILDNTIIGSDVEIRGSVIGESCVIGKGVVFQKGTVLGGFSTIS